MAATAEQTSPGIYTVTVNGMRIPNVPANNLGAYGISAPAQAPAQTTQPAPQQSAPVPSAPAQSSNPNLKQYSFQQQPNGLVKIFENGNDISQGGPGFSASYAQSLGFSPPQNNAPAQSAPAPAPQPQNAPQTQNQGSTQLGLLSAVSDVAKNAYNTGGQITLDEALKSAANDPNIIAKYGDALKLDQQGFQQALQQTQQQFSSDAQNQQQQFENDRRSLADKYANAGQAYSGFRGRAQQQLGQTESGIVQSSKSALQKSLNDLTSAFESRYGTSGTNPATATFTDPLAASKVSLSGQTTGGGAGASTLSGQMAGGITGTAPIQKKQDTLASAANLYELGQVPKQY